ncbi:MAG TPA: right-handed parallel beta-helix repeat-containing protein, partial [Gaiellaceae bacterium]
MRALRRALVAALLLAALAGAPQALSATYTVNLAGDAGDGACDASCTLRDAIIAANAAADADTIDFAVVPGGTVLVTPGSALPAIVQPVTIDGLTQPGAGGNPVIDIDGTGINADGLQVLAPSTIRGLVVRGFLLDGISVGSAAVGTSIERNHVGVDVAGTADFGNGQHGIDVSAANVSIGGDSASARNVVSGNGQAGIQFGGAGTAGSVARGNYVGTNAAGTAAIPNVNAGILLNGADNVTVGGSVPGAGNLVSGNTVVGIYFLGADNSRAWGNRVGTNAAGTGAVPNLIGVQILGGAGTATNNAVGGGLAGEGNVISGNTAEGILVNHILADAVSGNTIAGNIIGLTADGASPLANGSAGVSVAADADAPVAIGSTDPVDANTIASNTGAGIAVAAVSRQVAIGVNSIHDNGGLGIDLFPAGGVTPNDPAGDADAGGNDLQNFPVLTKAESGGGATDIEGTLTSAASTAYRVDHYLSTGCDASGNGEGSLLLGSQIVNTDGGGNGGFDFVYGAALAPGDVVTSIATDPTGNTSEFSGCFTVTTAGGFVVNSTADPGTGVCDGAECTLREAITAANAGVGTDTISFAIAAGVQTIVLATPLPAITDPVTIDATTQPGFGGLPLIELDGTATLDAAGLEIDAPDVEVKGLAVHSFDEEGIIVNPGATSARLTYLNVGTDSAGSVDLGNGGDGIRVEASGAEVGFNGEPNRIVGNDGAGVRVQSAGVTSTAIVNNFIGVGAAGTAVPNADGIALDPGTTLTLVRGNQVSGNTGSGIDIVASTDNTIQLTRIGTNNAGTAPLPNGVGVRIAVDDTGSALNTTIGGTGPTDGNVISGNSGDGILLETTDPDAVGNTVIQGNQIGADLSGTASVPNGGHGIHVGPNGGITNAVIGGTAAAAANRIRFNAGDGVLVEDGSSRVTILGNQIDGNGGLGIDLAPDGASPNDPGDGDAGGNALVNFPVVATAVAGASLQVTGTLDAAPPGGPYELDFYANTVCDPSGNGEGTRYLGRVTLLAVPGPFDTGGSLGPAAAGELITATATDALGNTSELSACVAATAQAAFVVTTGADSSLTPGCDATECTLREAIDGVNAYAGAGTPAIHFAIGSGPATISPTSPLPPLTGPAVVDGFTQPGAGAVPIVFLDGSSQSGGGDGLVLAAGSGASQIRGLAVGNFPDAGIVLGSDGNLVEDVFAGVAPGGAVAANGTGILVTGDANTIGGVNFGARNLLSGNNAAGLHIDGADGTTVRANQVGTDFAGTAALPNGTGIVVTTASSTTIGLPGPGGGSISAAVSGNSGDGIRVEASSTGTVIQGNVIGIASSGAILANGGHGIVVADTNGPTTIGGDQPELDNIIGGADNGIYLVLAQNTTVLGNKIGVDEAVTTAIGGPTVGIAIEDGGSNTIGGLGPGEGNVVGGAGDAGISVTASTNNTIVGNAIGTDPAGTLDFGNGTDGIRLASATTLSTLDRNTIGFNGAAGIAVVGSASNRNRITANAIDGNATLGIDLGANAVTPNDANDDDDGPNELQNFPVLASAPNIATETTVNGTLSSAPSTTYLVELFSSPTCSSSGNGEGRTFEDSVEATTNAAGDAPVFAILGDIPIGHVITATATDAVGNTSELGPCVAVTTGGPAPDATVGITATAGSSMAGAARVELANVPPSALLAGAGAQQTASAPLADIPLADIPLADIPMADIPLADIGFTGVAALLQRVPLASAPLLRPGGWPALLSGIPSLADRPLQTVTFGDVFGLAPVPPAVASITVDELDVSNSELGKLSEVVLPLGGALLADLPLDGADPLGDWCAELSAPPISCAGGGGSLAGSTVLSIALRGAPL